ncbi:hypothetical protein TIFTF001_025685 [Ficus carica]|uniref:Uncharacterized protein n=1 Tax=Ficus carica TaxID=3494 RepID=A0AA88DEE5_FICCA|nr:hypothetical protein TIFTF001_025685 [Ficus carica]
MVDKRDKAIQWPGVGAMSACPSMAPVWSPHDPPASPTAVSTDPKPPQLDWPLPLRVSLQIYNL